MKLNKRDLQTAFLAANAGISWFESLVEAHAHIPKDRKKFEAKVRKLQNFKIKIGEFWMAEHKAKEEKKT